MTGRRAIAEALREPMRRRGWTPRASGWFTRPISATQVGVVAVGAATEHSQPGAALATIYVHLRDQVIEIEVAQLTGSKDDGYRSTTAVTSLGYLMPEKRWREWTVSESNAEELAVDWAAAVETFALPHLERLSSEPLALGWCF